MKKRTCSKKLLLYPYVFMMTFLLCGCGRIPQDTTGYQNYEAGIDGAEISESFDESKENGVTVETEPTAGKPEPNSNITGPDGKETKLDTASLSPAEELTQFTEAIKKAVEAQSLEQLSDLCGYPVYIGLAGEEGREIASREEFNTLQSQAVFSEQLTAAVSQTNPDTMVSYGAGFVLGECSSVIISKIDGEMMITGLNP